METFSTAREFVENRGYARARQKSIAELDLASIDGPLVDIVEKFTALPHCFTIQCCYGHFLCAPEQDSHDLEPIPLGFSDSVTYRIAYIVVCLENSERGHVLRQALARLPALDPDYVQFGSADWFWEQSANSYVLQVEPKVHRFEDVATLGSAEALHTQGVRDLFFAELRVLLTAELSERGAG